MAVITQGIKSVIGGLNSNIIGSDNTNLILKGKAIKVLWGNRFIELIRDGKINVESLNILNVVSDTDSISENGIYINLETQEVWVYIDGYKINLTNSSYLSFMIEQNLDANQKYLTLSNAGLYYKTLDDAKDIKAGIIYVEDEKKLYIIKDGKLLDYLLSIELSEPSFGDLKISKTTIDGSSIILSINNTPYISLTDKIYLEKDVATNYIASVGAANNYGFRLYEVNGVSTLEIDNIINRSEYENNAIIYSKFSNTIINSEMDSSGNKVYTLLKPNLFKVGDIVYTLVKYTNILTVQYDEQTITASTSYPVSSKVDLLITVNDTVYNLSINEGETSSTIMVEEDIESIDYQIINGPDEVSLTDSNDRYLVKYLITEATDTSISFIGDLDYINCKIYGQPLIKIQDGNLEVINEDLTRVKIGTIYNGKSGIESDNITGTATNLVFGEEYPKYSNLSIPVESLNESYNLVVPNIEWVKKLISSYLPIGTIIMYNGASEIPEDWTICDGSHGSPDLVGKFIKASSDTVGPTIINENNEITITEENLPKHSHSYSIDENTSTGTISETISTGTIGETISTGTIDGYLTYDEGVLTTNTFSNTISSYIEIINIPKDSEGNITDDTIKNWGTTQVSYDLGDINYTPRLSMNPHTHTLEMGSHIHSLSMNPHSHSIKEQEQEWKNTPIKIEPNYYSLIFIMKWK